MSKPEFDAVVQVDAAIAGNSVAPLTPALSPRRGSRFVLSSVILDLKK